MLMFLNKKELWRLYDLETFGVVVLASVPE